MKYISLVFSLLMVNNLFAYHVIGSEAKPKKGEGDQFGGKANCAPATSKLTLEFNDVRALLNTNGVLFLDRAAMTAGYEVPKTNSGPRTRAIYAAALWMGGVDPQGNLKLAATTFGEGNDFWTGPLSVTLGSGNYDPRFPVGHSAKRDWGEATIDPDQCKKYDKYFTIRKAEVIAFISWWEDSQNGSPENIEQPSAEIMNRIINWPAHGDQTRGQDHYLAPFFDRPPAPGQQGNGIYNALEDGDYPWYDDILGRDDIACGSDRRISLFGDETHWWIFNDRGNIHTSSIGAPIGMEIRAQAFAFTTNDEINKMTFYNYEMINRGSMELKDTYFAQYVDPDLGGAFDDYVGCDVSRGLGYCYNGKSFDADYQGNAGYGANPPAIGVDFFEGPYQNADGRDNVGPVFDTITKQWVIPSVAQAIADSGIVYKGLGIGYGDGIVDNERFGMKRFCYYINAGPVAQADPQNAAQFYNYMSGKWKFGDDMIFGGTGFGTGIHADYMFPADSDPLFWSTRGIPTNFAWAENNIDGSGASNPVGDRRFVQSAGPFSLKSGAINNITVGIVYARSAESDLFASVRALKIADTKAQALFDNCFEILEPPTAPLLKIQELNNELILMLSNSPQGNNRHEDYIKEDKVNIVDGDTIVYDKFYRFEGYQIFQLKDASVSVSDIGNTDKARLVAQCDLKNEHSDLFNYTLDEELNIIQGKRMVQGENKGIRHTFNVKEDLFAQGVRTLVNHKKYYYVAIAYAVNQYKKYNPSEASSLDGQKMPYLPSRIGADGKAIPSMEAIPHNPMPELGGTVQKIGYGQTPEITRIDGIGNGNIGLELTKASLTEIITSGYVKEPTYQIGQGPLNVKVVDPLNLAGGYYEIEFNKYNLPNNPQEYNNYYGTDTASWIIRRYTEKNGQLLGSVTSERTISNKNEQIIPEWGVSVEVYQVPYYNAAKPDEKVGQSTEYTRTTDVISSSITFADSSKRWLTFVKDNTDYYPSNWILSGTFKKDANGQVVVRDPMYLTDSLYYSEPDVDPNNMYSKLLDGGIAPHRLTGYKAEYSPISYPIGTGMLTTTDISNLRRRAGISRNPSVKIVLTSDKSKWTRCAVIELGRNVTLNQGQGKPGLLRKATSLDINGNPIAGSEGMSWFPGYAIDLESGMRLHMAFGENSFLSSDNGTDMKWNPSTRLAAPNGNPIFGGQHAIYVFGYNINGNGCPYYDGVNDWVYDQLKTANKASLTNAYQSLVWVVNPLLAANQNLLSTDVSLDVKINKEYSERTATGRNGGRPMYSWSMDAIRADVGSRDALVSALDMINVVPNPYYAFSTYETTRLDTRVKIVNLPDQCVVKIYNVSGKLVRTFKKDSPITSLDWDLKNSKGIPIASGVYLIHVQVEGAGEKVVKFFGGMRQPDLENI